MTAAQTPPVKKFEFDAAFQSKIAAFMVRDSIFVEQTEGLIIPEYFNKAAEATLVNIALGYFEKYRRIPEKSIFVGRLLRNAIDKKIIRADLKDEVIETLRALFKADIGDRDFVVDEVSDFARHRAIEIAFIKSVGFLEKRRFDDLEKAMGKAFDVGASKAPEYDYFEQIDARTEERKEMLAGNMQPKGVTTGIIRMDERLYHKGWGRGELSVYMGGPKVGKTTGLINAALAAVFAGKNVLHVTLEVSKEIFSARADSNLANLTMDELKNHPFDANKRIKDAAAIAFNNNTLGLLKVHEYPSGTFSPADLRRLINRYKAKGIAFDLVTIDYLDIMCPNFRYDNEIANSKSVWIDVRACAQEENFAVLSATQTNREGYKASTAKSEHAADDFNKVRTADLIISINATEEEQKRHEARLYFAASRNQAGNFSILVKQDLERMKFVLQVLQVID